MYNNLYRNTHTFLAHTHLTPSSAPTCAECEGRREAGEQAQAVRQKHRQEPDMRINLRVKSNTLAADLVKLLLANNRAKRDDRGREGAVGRHLTHVQI